MGGKMNDINTILDSSGLNPHMIFVADFDITIMSLKSIKRQWCRDNVGPAGKDTWFVVGCRGFKFAYEEDALAYKLRWGSRKG